VAPDLPTVLALVGPTAVGKTDVALALADRHEVSLISLDSAMVYRGMDIGTAKPEPEVLARYPHALVDIRDPSEPYSAADYVRDADREVAAALAGGRLPVLVGGTMLYLRAFREGLAEMPAADPEVRARLAREAERLGSAALHRRLTAIDPTAAEGIHPHNFARIQRALEVYELTGVPLSSLWGDAEEVSKRLGARLVVVSLEPEDRELLKDRIARRLDAMLARGFVAEVARLRSRGDLTPDLPALKAVGYRQVWGFLDGTTDEVQMREQVLAATRQLARRQLTWLRSWPGISRLAPAAPGALAAELVRRLGV
jgi:tRNA dimethylallyltransferase